ncbi:hemerythrin domain-containing protein [Caenispirillum bisanense]|uniref:bacteriohemerythrin n=1 Tax=Caenispirillum bisanense TaxID=414052 RepID=UPI0031DF551A
MLGFFAEVLMTFIDPARLPDTGHPLIDQGHAVLADLANDLYLAWQQGRTAALGPQAARFVAALADHFAAEERIMAEVGLETAADHCRRHADLLAEFTALAEMLEGVPALCADVMVDLFRATERLVWEHEMVDDQDFWVHFAGQGRAPAVLIDWGPQVAVGHPEIDSQHHTLITLVNELHAAVVARVGREALMGRLIALRRFSSRHFGWEERMMAIIPGARCDDHVALHAALLADLDRVLADLRAGRFDTVEDLLCTYVKHWLLEHIGTQDRRLAARLLAAEDAGQSLSRPA